MFGLSCLFLLKNKVIRLLSDYVPSSPLVPSRQVSCLLHRCWFLPVSSLLCHCWSRTASLPLLCQLPPDTHLLHFAHFFSSTSTGSFQRLGPTFGGTAVLSGLGFLVCSAALMYGHPGSTSVLRAHDFTLVCWSIGSTLAPWSLASTWTVIPGSGRLPRASSLWLHHRLPGIRLCLSPTPLLLQWAPPSLLLHRCPRLLRLYRGLPSPCLYLSPMSR